MKITKNNILDSFHMDKQVHNMKSSHATKKENEFGETM